ncbi:MAG: DegT/DnrJ/EryC1/StrS family aminotransferase [bacterium]
MHVPFLDLARQDAPLRVALNHAYRRVVASGRLLFGPELRAFEAELGAWLGGRHVVGVASGTDALEIALRASGLEPGEPVQTTAFTAVATINAIEAAGGIPVLRDVDPQTRNADAWQPGTRRCRMAVGVHLYGLPCRLPTWESAVEDVAHALGARLDGRRVGALGRVAALSFYPTKNLGALGDGGAVVTDDDGLAARAREIRHYGGLDRGDVTSRGLNSRLSELQAAFLRVKLPRLDDWNARRRAIAARYRASLAGRVGLPTEPAGGESVYHLFVIEHPERERLAQGLAHAGIGTMVHYPKALHEHSRYAALAEPGQFPVAERLARTVLSLPCFPELTDAEVDRVIAALRDLT